MTELRKIYESKLKEGKIKNYYSIFYLKQKLKDRFGDDIQFYYPTKRNSPEIVFSGREQLLMVEQSIVDGTAAEDRPLEMEDGDEHGEMV